jgi:hypothetical protein
MTATFFCNRTISMVRAKSITEWIDVAEKLANETLHTFCRFDVYLGYSFQVCVKFR